MALYGDYLYWTDWILRGVLRVSKFGDDELVWLKKGIPRQPMGIVAVANDTDDCKSNSDILKLKMLYGKKKSLI